VDEPLADPLAALVAVAPGEYDAGEAAAAEVTVNVDVPDAFGASASVEIENVPDHPLATVPVNAKLFVAHVAESLFVTVTVYASAVPANADCELGDSATVGAARTHAVPTT
jgi:hypothetical protein